MKASSNNRKNGQLQTARNPRAAGRPRDVLSPDVLERRREMRAARNKRFEESHARINVYVSPETSEAIAQEAARKGVSKSSIAQKVLEKHFAEKKIKPFKGVNRGTSKTPSQKKIKKNVKKC